ncbi:MAG: hypothetical protein JJU10_05455 [Idiomarina sp.]|nr:hypothetical protein [Idiomarina sp.]
MASRKVTKLNAQAFLKTPPLKSETIKVPEWGGREITIQEMDGLSRAEYEDAIQNEIFRDKSDTEKLNQKAWRRLYPSLVIAAAMPESDRGGLSLIDLAEAIARWPSKGITRVYLRADTINALSDRAMDELEKNSESDPSKDSPGESR